VFRSFRKSQTTTEQASAEAALRAQIRGRIVTAILQNPLAAIAEPGAKERLLAGDDVSFDELGLDSLARLTLAVDLDEQGFPVSEADVNEAGSVDALAAFLCQL
jgi:acyl carrier protein